MNKEGIRLVQLFHPQYNRRVALVKEPSLILLKGIHSNYDLALEAIHAKKKIEDYVQSKLTDELLDYSSVYNGKSEWKLLPSFDHPTGPFGCIVSGTGLTHKNSALNRQMMHISADDKLTDSMKMYQWGVDGGFPEKGKIGVQPEWFYKGNGSSLRAHGETLEVPEFGNDGGEEPEIAGLYIVDKKGHPWRIGFTTGNEFSDHIMEKKNYLYLAPSKLRQCAIGPELLIDSSFESFEGTVNIQRQQETVWSSDIKSGEKNMAHSLENLEYHHFKYPGHRVSLQAHVHFFGADAFSFGQGIQLQDGDLMRIQWNGLGRALENPITISEDEEKMIRVKSL
ncbi:MAG: GguC protein [Bacteroidia bacterium]|nr:GguC protein [Bacteroidia bacterium]